jgi:membrane fusion protein (multidrug efflux system)
MATHPLFRGEALEHHRRGGMRGDVLQLTPRSLFWTHWLLLLALAAAIYFAFVGQIDEVAAGPAVVQVSGVHEITAPRPAVVSSVEVTPGQRVKRGQLLLRMHSSAEVSELESAERELQDQLAKLLREPGDAVAREAIVALRSRRDLAAAKLARQEVRAPEDGTVGDVRVRTGQLVDPGMPVVTLLGDAGGAEVTALLPGRYRPLLHPGMELRFVADGFQRAVQALKIERVGDQIVGASEAARYLGRDLGGSLQLAGPVVLVHARLDDLEFESEDERYRFHHGMHGRAESVVRQDSIAFTFVPGLEQLFDNVR